MHLPSFVQIREGHYLFVLIWYGMTHMQNYGNKENVLHHQNTHDPRVSCSKFGLAAERTQHNILLWWFDAQCRCQTVPQWSPDDWYGTDSLYRHLEMHLSVSGKIDHELLPTHNYVCRSHYRNIMRCRKLRSCSMSFNNSWWKYACEITNDEHFPIHKMIARNMTGYVCKTCRLCFTNTITFCVTLE